MNPMSLAPSSPALRSLLASCPRLFVLTGAGCSARSGIPDYRNPDGSRKHPPPVLYQEFLRSEAVRRCYWARSGTGWKRIASALPNRAHHALARLERSGRVHVLVTQNVDGLHQKAGSRRVIDLHGRLDSVLCLHCLSRFHRQQIQRQLEALNPDWNFERGEAAPDGDSQWTGASLDNFRVPPCRRCGGVLKPAIVFFGEGVPKSRVDRAMFRLREADALLVVGSSLMVWSGYRFVREAVQQRIPVAILNLGRTRADDQATLKVDAACGEVLSRLANELSAGAAPLGEYVPARTDPLP